MEEKSKPTPNEIFAEQISLLRKIYQGRHCAVCNDQMFLGFRTVQNGTIELMKCYCATFGPTEYSRIQEHLHNIDSNITGQLSVLQKNMQELVNYQHKCFCTIALRLEKTVCEIESIKRNTFFGGIKYCNKIIIELLGGARDPKKENKIIVEIKPTEETSNVDEKTS
jgi:hypothetical protein